MSTPNPPEVDTHCNACLNQTRHKVIAEVRKREYAEDHNGRPIDDIFVQHRWTMLKCLGCGDVCLSHYEIFSEAEPGEGTEHYYPPRTARRSPSWADNLPSTAHDLLTEVYAALHADNRRLAIMGARTLIDVVCVDKVGDLGSFPAKLNAMEKDGYLGAKHREFLEPALEAGHAAIHRGHVATQEQVGHVMDIVENILQAAYMLDSAANELRNTIPLRNRK